MLLQERRLMRADGEGMMEARRGDGGLEVRRAAAAEPSDKARGPLTRQLKRRQKVKIGRTSSGGTAGGSESGTAEPRRRSARLIQPDINEQVSQR